MEACAGQIVSLATRPFCQGRQEATWAMLSPLSKRFLHFYLFLYFIFIHLSFVLVLVGLSACTEFGSQI
jgi:hypothetical protein